MEDVVARAKIQSFTEKNKHGTIFAEGKPVVLHHPRHPPACMQRKTKKRGITRGTFRAIVKSGKGSRCPRCWTDRKWENALAVRSAKPQPEVVTGDPKPKPKPKKRKAKSKDREVPKDGIYRIDDWI